jgi:transposase-like protein
MQTPSPLFTQVAVKSGTRLRHYSKAERQHHCESWRRSGLSMSEYCRQTGVSVSTLSKWAHDTQSTELLPKNDDSIHSPPSEKILRN